MAVALKEIDAEMENASSSFKSEDKLIEAQRIEQRTRYDIEMLSEIGMCKGIENYSRVLSAVSPAPAVYTARLFPGRFSAVR